MTKKKYDDCFLMPEITQVGEFQVFNMKGKDSRGYDFSVRLSAISESTVPGDIPEIVDADRLEVYLGGKPDEIGKIDGEVEVTLGQKKEIHSISKAAMVYVPGGTPVKHRVTREPAETTWLLNYTLTPRWVDPEEKQEGS